MSMQANAYNKFENAPLWGVLLVGTIAMGGGIALLITVLVKTHFLQGGFLSTLGKCGVVSGSMLIGGGFVMSFMASGALEKSLDEKREKDQKDSETAAHTPLKKEK